MTFIYLVAGWVAGLVMAAWLRLPTPVWLVLQALPIGYLILFWRDPLLRKWHFVLFLFVLGALRYQLALPDALSQELQQFNEQGRASLIGVVVADPDVRQTQTLVRVEVSKLQTHGEWRDVHGLALVSVPRDTPVKYGDEVQVDGAPETPPDAADFSYRDYLARENVFTLVRTTRLFTIASGKGNVFWAALYEMNAAAQNAVNQLLPEPSAALLNGILLGNDRGLPDEVKQAFANTNTAHVIAISGYNIAVLISVLAFALRKPGQVLHGYLANRMGRVEGRGQRSQHLITIVILVLLVLYTLLVGASASVVRACIMGALSLIAFSFGRQSWAVNALAIAAFVMTLANPYVLWDIGFQLSFLATLGLLLYVPRMTEWLERWLKTRTNESRARTMLAFFQDAILVTLAAFLVTAPLLVLYFHRLSLIGFLTNVLVLPVQPAVMVLGGAATLMQLAANALSAVPLLPLLLGALAQGLAWGAYVCLQYTLLVVEATAAIPFGSLEVPRIDTPLVVLFYVGLFGVTALGARRTANLVLTRIWVPITVLAVAVIFVWTSALAAPDARTRVMFIAADEGDATFVRTAQDYRILINGTGEPGTLLSFLGTQLPPWDRRIDLVIATHLDDANLSSLNTVLERYTVGRILEPFRPARAGVSYAKWRDLTEQKQIGVVAAQAGTELRAGETVFEVVYPEIETDSSYVALRMRAENKTFLFAPALRQTDVMQMLADKAWVDADVAVLPNMVTEDVMAQVTPETVILFVGKSAREKPSAELMKLLEGVEVVRTDERGTLTFIVGRDKVEAAEFK